MYSDYTKLLLERKEEKQNQEGPINHSRQILLLKRDLMTIPGTDVPWWRCECLFGPEKIYLIAKLQVLRFKLYGKVLLFPDCGAVGADMSLLKEEQVTKNYFIYSGKTFSSYYGKPWCVCVCILIVSSKHTEILFQLWERYRTLTRFWPSLTRLWHTLAVLFCLKGRKMG